MPAMSTDRSRALAWVALAYALALLAAVWTHGLLAERPAWQALLAADLVATLVVFGFSATFDNSSFYDPYWSITPVILALALALCHAAPGVPALRQGLVLALVAVWGLRLTWNWVRSWPGLHHEDWRYVDLRGKTGPLYWLFSLAGLHLMPTLAVFTACLPLFPALRTGTRPVGLLDLLATGVTAAGVALEGIADQQLRDFRLRGEGGPLRTGLWGRCRHPNYLGEMLFWWGLYLFGLAAAQSRWPLALWGGVGAAWITCLFLFYSIPMMDRRSLARRPGYKEVMDQVPALWPF